MFAYYAVGFGALSSFLEGADFPRAAVAGVGFGITLILFQLGQVAWKRRRHSPS
jgi:hypothetical protein